MFQRYVVGLLAIALVITSAGCGKQNEPQPEITDVVYANIKALQAEDMQAVLATIDENSPGYAPASQLISDTFANYDLSYELSDVKLENVTGEQATVTCVQTTRKLAGSHPFTDTRLTVKHLLKKNNAGSWKIFSTQILEMKAID